MRFLIDENLPIATGNIFTARGFEVAHVADLPELRGKPDEVVFDYAAYRGFGRSAFYAFGSDRTRIHPY